MASRTAKGKDKFSTNMVYHFDREVALSSNKGFKQLYEHKIVNNYKDFKMWLEKVKKANLSLTGNENVVLINRMVNDKLY